MTEKPVVKKRGRPPAEGARRIRIGCRISPETYAYLETHFLKTQRAKNIGRAIDLAIGVSITET